VFGFFMLSCLRSLSGQRACIIMKGYALMLQKSIITPRDIIFFLTERCNGRCEHCFLPAERGDNQQELSVQVIRTIFRSLRHTASLVVTGGEPFLRKDIDEVIDGLFGIAQIQAIGICSNGSLPDSIEALVQNMGNKHKKPLCVQISLDGLSATHDAIRKIPNGFVKALDTCDRLKRLNKQYPHCSYSVHITAMKPNIKEIIPLIRYLQKKGHPNKFSVVRGNAFSTFDVPEEILNKNYGPANDDIAISADDLELLVKSIETHFPGYIDTSRKQYFETIIKVLRTKKRSYRCVAGYSDAVIYSTGDIAACEQVIPFGNLAQWGWDLLRAWRSPEANTCRMKLRSCACIHGCNIGSAINEEMRKNKRKEMN